MGLARFAIGPTSSALGVLAVLVALTAVVRAPVAELPALAPLPAPAADRPGSMAIALRWQRDLGSPITGALAVLSERVVVTTADGFLHGLSHGGVPRFRVRLPGPKSTRCEGGPTALDDGGVAVGTTSGWLALVDTDGRMRTTRPLAAPVLAAPAEGAAGMLWVVSGGQLLGLGPDLQTRLSVPISGPVVAAPVVGPGGEVFLATQGHRLFGLSVTGSVRFAVDFGQELDARPVVRDGRVYVAGDGGLVAGLRAVDGQVLFRRQVDGHVRSPLALHGGNLWLQTMGPRPALLALDGRTGETLGGHRFGFVDDAGTGSRSGVTLGPGGQSLWVGGPDDALHVFDRSGRPLGRFATGGDIDATPTPAPGGQVYVASADGILRSFSGR